MARVRHPGSAGAHRHRRRRRRPGRPRGGDGHVGGDERTPARPHPRGRVRREPRRRPAAPGRAVHRGVVGRLRSGRFRRGPRGRGRGNRLALRRGDRGHRRSRPLRRRGRVRRDDRRDAGRRARLDLRLEVRLRARVARRGTGPHLPARVHEHRARAVRLRHPAGDQLLHLGPHRKRPDARAHQRGPLGPRRPDLRGRPGRLPPVPDQPRGRPRTGLRRPRGVRGRR